MEGKGEERGWRHKKREKKVMGILKRERKELREEEGDG